MVNDCDDIMDGSKERSRGGGDPKGGHYDQLEQVETTLRECYQLPTQKEPWKPYEPE